MKKVLIILLFIGITSTGHSQKLYTAVEKSDIKKVEKLITKGEDVDEYNKNGLFPLWRATSDNNEKITKLLIEAGANVNQANKVSPANSPSIILPCQEGYFEIVKLLVENGADVNYSGFKKFTPIRIATRNGHIEIVKYLAENGANIDAKAEDGATPLEHAAYLGHIEIVKYLVEKGANINNIDKEGDFPIGEAAKQGRLDVVQYLINQGADLTLKNDKNKTAYDMAKEKGQKKVAFLIEKQSIKK
jgi:uncharacterized protein